jgi:arylsulfatase A-like enzyme
VKDLKQRGLLDDTLVLFGSEFGRTPFAQGTLKAGYGRDHHGGNFTWWMAGAGTKAGYAHGETDDFSYSIVKDGVHIHDLNATLLYILGIDHDRLTFKYQGRDFKLTDVYGKSGQTDPRVAQPYGGSLQRTSKRDRIRASQRAGQTASELRQAIAAGDPPHGLVPFIDKIRSQAWTVTAADVDALRSCYNEDELFEIILAAAFGAADDRLRAARRALDEA